jgi:hypothetical protein
MYSENSAPFAAEYIPATALNAPIVTMSLLADLFILSFALSTVHFLFSSVLLFARGHDRIACA